jgi:SAM-dependent methyltransferase
MPVEDHAQTPSSSTVSSVARHVPFTSRGGVPVRLNWGCGPVIARGWLNADRLPAPGVDLCGEILDGLPLETDSVDYAVGIHVVQDLPYLDVVPALRELHRVLRRDGTLRLGLPDLDRAIQAYMNHNLGYFHIPNDDAATIGGKLVAQLVWYGSVRTPFTYDCIAEMLRKAGFRRPVRCRFRETTSGIPDIVDLDNRERESLFVEAVK